MAAAPPAARADEPIPDDAIDPIETGIDRARRAGLAGTIEADLLGLRSLSFARWAAATWDRLKGEVGWQPTRSAWPEALEETVKWYVDHPDWWKRVKSGAYREYYEKQYAGR